MVVRWLLVSPTVTERGLLPMEGKVPSLKKVPSPLLIITISWPLEWSVASIAWTMSRCPSLFTSTKVVHAHRIEQRVGER